MLRLVCVALLLTLRVTLADAAESGDLKAGAAVADITPQKWPVELVGSFSQRLADHAWDPLSARALVLDNGHERIGFVVVDSCFCPRAVFDDVRERVSKLCGIAPDHLLCSATHTHTAPPSRDRTDGKADPEYVEHLKRGMVSALQQATANLAPAEIAWGSAQCPEEVHNRRWFLKPGKMPVNPFGETTDQVKMNPPRNPDVLDRPAGPTDPEISFLSVRTRTGRPISLLANYSLHYVGDIPAGGVSSDYFGEFAHQIERRLFPQGQTDALAPFVGILSNGTSGDCNNIRFQGQAPPSGPPFTRIRAVASLVADRVFEAAQKLEYRSSIPLKMAQAELTLKVRKPTEAEIARARRFLAEEDEMKLPPLAKAYARRALELAEHPGTEAIVLQAVRVGDVGITTIPCETFAETGLRLKADSPLKPSFTIELANGHYGYLPTPDQHRLGGYETWLGTNRLEVEASTKIEERLLELLKVVAN